MAKPLERFGPDLPPLGLLPRAFLCHGVLPRQFLFGKVEHDEEAVDPLGECGAMLVERGQLSLVMREEAV